MQLTIQTPSGDVVSGDAIHWLCAVIASLPPEQLQNVMYTMTSREELKVLAPKNHVVSVPSIESKETFGKF
jgi:hypothetical protein